MDLEMELRLSMEVDLVVAAMKIGEGRGWMCVAVADFI
jgi:hypothetical protein